MVISDHPLLFHDIRCRIRKKRKLHVTKLHVSYTLVIQLTRWKGYSNLVSIPGLLLTMTSCVFHWPICHTQREMLGKCRRESFSSLHQLMTARKSDSKLLWSLSSYVQSMDVSPWYIFWNVKKHQTPKANQKWGAPQQRVSKEVRVHRKIIRMNQMNAQGKVRRMDGVAWRMERERSRREVWMSEKSFEDMDCSWLFG